VAGFTFEAINYFGLEPQPRAGFVPFYRCYWNGVGKHFYTQAANCEGADARNEGIIGYIASGPSAGTSPLYRMYSPNTADHLYTTWFDEVLLANLNNGYQYEGIVGYVYLP
jgi:hypothetical protein